GIYRVNPAADQSELRVVVGDTPDANDKFVVGRSSASTEGGIPTGNFTPTFTVRSDGNVGIGTTAPGAGLHIDAPEPTTTGLASLGVQLSGGTGDNPKLELRGDGRTPYIDFAENANDDYTTRLRSIGGVLNVEGTGASGLLFKVNGSVQANNVVFTSDARFKQHVRPIGSALASVLALRGVRYEWNALGIKHGGTAGAGQVGVIAQEVESIYPELVSTDKDGYKAVNYAQLTPVLIEAIKELKAENDALKARTATAEANASAAKAQAAQATATLDTFEARLRRLEAGSAAHAQR
ncbi:MAG: tail fiber domain-containing protein, partial [Hymenobacter sp.]